MVSVDFKNNLLEFIFYGLFSEHTQTNIINGLQFYPKAGVAFRKDLRFRKRAVYQREIMVFYQLDKIDEPKKSHHYCISFRENEKSYSFRYSAKPPSSY